MLSLSPEPPSDVVAAGDPDPDVTGIFEFAGYFNGKPYWSHTVLIMLLWYSTTTGTWNISDALGQEDIGWQTQSGDSYLNIYYSLGDYSGVVTIS